MGTETVSEVENDYAGCELFMEADSIDDEPAPEVRSSARGDGRTVREARIASFLQHTDALVEVIHSICFDEEGNFSLPRYKCWESDESGPGGAPSRTVKVFTQYGVETASRSSDVIEYVKRGLMPPSTDVRSISHVMELSLVLDILNLSMNGAKVHGIIAAKLMSWSPPMFAIPKMYPNADTQSPACYLKTLAASEQCELKNTFGHFGDRAQFKECAWITVRVMRVLVLAMRNWSPGVSFGSAPVQPRIECLACGAETKDMKRQGCFPCRSAFDACFKNCGKKERGPGGDENNSSIAGVIYAETAQFGDTEQDGSGCQPKQAEHKRNSKTLDNTARCGGSFYQAILNQDDGNSYRSGVAGTVCVHGVCSALIDLARGEKYHIALQALNLSHLKSPGLRPCRRLFGYDIACLWRRWLGPRQEKSDEIRELTRNIAPVTPAFHATTHGWNCWSQLHVRVTKGAGLVDLEDTERFWSVFEKVLPSSLPYMSVTHRIETMSAAVVWVSENSNVTIPSQLVRRLKRARLLATQSPKSARYDALSDIPVSPDEAPSVQRAILIREVNRAGKEDVGLRGRLQRKLKAVDIALAKRPEGDLPNATRVEYLSGEALAIMHNNRLLRSVEECRYLVGEASVYLARLSNKVKRGEKHLANILAESLPCSWAAHFGRMRWQQLYNKHLLGLATYQFRAAKLEIDSSTRDYSLETLCRPSMSNPGYRLDIQNILHLRTPKAPPRRYIPRAPSVLPLLATLNHDRDVLPAPSPSPNPLAVSARRKTSVTKQQPQRVLTATQKKGASQSSVSTTTSGGDNNACYIVTRAQLEAIDLLTENLYLPPISGDRITWASTSSLYNAQQALNRRAHPRNDAAIGLFVPCPVSYYETTYSTNKYVEEKLQDVENMAKNSSATSSIFFGGAANISNQHWIAVCIGKCPTHKLCASVWDPFGSTTHARRLAVCMRNNGFAVKVHDRKIQYDGFNCGWATVLLTSAQMQQSTCLHDEVELPATYNSDDARSKTDEMMQFREFLRDLCIEDFMTGVLPHSMADERLPSEAVEMNSRMKQVRLSMKRKAEATRRKAREELGGELNGRKKDVVDLLNDDEKNVYCWHTWKLREECLPVRIGADETFTDNVSSSRLRACCLSQAAGT